LSNEEKKKDYENFEKGMIYMKILKKKGRVVEKRRGGGNEIHVPCACDPHNNRSRIWSLFFGISYVTLELAVCI
jgi:hypothetical protein